MNTIAYLQEMSGWLFLRCAGELIDDPATLDLIADRLKQTAQYIRESTTNRGVYDLQAAIILSEGSCDDITWIFPKTRKEYRGIKSCVYFLTMPNRPRLIKIGCTTRALTERSGQIAYEFNGQASIRAIVCTSKPRQVEKYFHLTFAEHLIDRKEWFALAPVAKYLRSIRHQMEMQTTDEQPVRR